jgi:hypothetical protein
MEVAFASEYEVEKLQLLSVRNKQESTFLPLKLADMKVKPIYSVSQVN